MRIDILNKGVGFQVIVFNLHGMVEHSEYFDTYESAYRSKSLCEATWRAVTDGTY